MPITANEDRLNARADMVIAREMIAYLIAQHLDIGKAQGNLETLKNRVTAQLNQEVTEESKKSRQHGKKEKERYENRLKLFLAAVTAYQT